MTSDSVLKFKFTSLVFITQCLFLLFISWSEGGSSADKFSEFDWALSKAVGEEVDKNVIISPISIKLLLAMLYEGAQGNTSKQLEDALNFQRSSRHYKTEKFIDVLKSLHMESNEYDLDIGTKLFLDKKTKLNPKYEERLKEIYNSTVDKVDFTKPETVMNINKWAEILTNGHIKDLISRGDTKDNVALLLLNAIYFKGQWLQPFRLNETEKRNFTINSTKMVKDIPFMTSTQSQKYYNSEELDAAIIQLPYMGAKFSMYIILPNEVDGLKQLLKNLTPDLLRDHLRDMEEGTEYPVKIYLPKFHFDFSSSLRAPLEKLGLKDMFTGKANLSGITNDNLMVSNIIQKAGILVNEQGSTAYVVSEIELVNKFGDTQTNFIADHPFVFFIQDETTKTVVFVGKVVNPGPQGAPLYDWVQPTSPKPPNTLYYENVNYPATYKPTESHNTISPDNNQRPATEQANYWMGESNQQELQPSSMNSGKKQGPQQAGDNWMGPSQIGISGSQIHESNIHGFQQSGMVQPGPYPTGINMVTSGQSSMDSSPVAPAVPLQYPVSKFPGKDADSGGYYNSTGDYIRQNFNHDRWAFFDTELMKTICDTEGYKNWITSPSSIKTVLGIIYEGTSGKTSDDIASMLRLPNNKTRGLRVLHSIQRAYNEPPDQNVNVHWIMANRILTSPKLPLVPEYRNHLANLYHARIDPAKFDSPNQTAQDINNWINNITNGFVPTLASPDAIDPDAKLILLNAVYFKSDWLYPFKKRFSQKECFYPQPTECSKVIMMRQKAFFKYGLYKELLAHVIELPYADQRFSMVIVLPEYEGGLVDVVRDLPKCPLLPFVRDMAVAEVDLSLPAFSVEYSKDLTHIITSLGGGSMFSDSKDFGNMIGRNNQAKISKIIHKAKVVVNERGTEAGAGTAAVIVPLMNSQLVQLSINHPFLFFIRDQTTGFLFSGQIVNPAN